jgi:fluoride exporter
VNLADLAWVGLAGSAGAVARSAVDGALRSRLFFRAAAGTVTVNLTGSFVLGLLAGLVLCHAAPSGLQLVAGTGFCGGYTTFSAASYETVRLAQNGEARAAAANAGANLAGSLLMAALGLALASS